MFSVSDKGKILFKKGTKPRALDDAQRSVCDVYKMLCSKDAPAGFEKAFAFWEQAQGGSADTLFKRFPYYQAIVASASRAYSGMGKALAGSKMYHMDITLSIDDLLNLKLDTLAAELTREFPDLTEFEFHARTQDTWISKS